MDGSLPALILPECVGLSGSGADLHAFMCDIRNPRIRRAFDWVWRAISYTKRELITMVTDEVCDHPHHETYGATKTAHGYWTLADGRGVIYLSPDLAREPMDFVLATVAHELGHPLYLGEEGNLAELHCNYFAKALGFWHPRLQAATPWLSRSSK